MEEKPDKNDIFLDQFIKINNQNLELLNLRIDDNAGIIDNKDFKFCNFLDNFDFMKFGSLILPRFKLSSFKDVEKGKNSNNNTLQKSEIDSNLEDTNKEENLSTKNIKDTNPDGYNISSSLNSENCKEIKEINIENNNIIKPLIKKKANYRKVFNLKVYDKYYNLITKKRGRLSLNKKITHIHSAVDYDNVLRKIQVHSLSFLVNFTNDYIASLSKNSCGIPYFRQIQYKIKRKINHSFIKEIKSLTIGEILQYPVSKKNRSCKENQNILTYQEIIKLFPFLETSYFNLSLKNFFFQFYYNKCKKAIKINDVEVNFSNKTRNFNHLIQKNPKYSEKFRSIAIYFYINNHDDKNKKNGYKEENKEKEEMVKQKPLFIIE